MGIPGALVQELAEPGMRCTSVALLGDGHTRTISYRFRRDLMGFIIIAYSQYVWIPIVG